MTDRDHFTNPDATADVYEWLASARRERVAAVLATVVEVTGSAPQVPGAKLLLLADGRAAGTVGGGAFERRVLEEAQSLAGADGTASRLVTLNLTRDLGMCCGGEMRVFLERVLGPERLVVFGAGHIGRALCEAAAAVGFEVTVVDEREAWATAGRFPAALRVLCEEPEAALPQLGIDAATYCVVATHSHPLDQAIVTALLATPARLVGMVGSRTKRAKFLMRLRARGMAEETLARLRTPLGLEIGAVTPEEIAVSILAELVGVRRGAVGGEADGGGRGGLWRVRRRGAATEAAAQEEGG
jgi:xanthine dehydrogenase accessory factor